jgi:hypothetical protein
LVVRGRLDNVHGVLNLVADKAVPLRIAAAAQSRDWR